MQIWLAYLVADPEILQDLLNLLCKSNAGVRIWYLNEVEQDRDRLSLQR